MRVFYNLNLFQINLVLTHLDWKSYFRCEKAIEMRKANKPFPVKGFTCLERKFQSSI